MWRWIQTTRRQRSHPPFTPPFRDQVVAGAGRADRARHRKKRFTSRYLTNRCIHGWLDSLVDMLHPVRGANRCKGHYSAGAARSGEQCCISTGHPDAHTVGGWSKDTEPLQGPGNPLLRVTALHGSCRASTLRRGDDLLPLVHLFFKQVHRGE